MPVPGFFVPAFLSGEHHIKPPSLYWAWCSTLPAPGARHGRCLPPRTSPATPHAGPLDVPRRRRDRWTLLRPTFLYRCGPPPTATTLHQHFAPRTWLRATPRLPLPSDVLPPHPFLPACPFLLRDAGWYRCTPYQLGPCPRTFPSPPIPHRLLYTPYTSSHFHLTVPSTVWFGCRFSLLSPH